LKFKSSLCEDKCLNQANNLSINVTSFISAEIASKGKEKEDPSLHPNYPKNLIPEHYFEFEDVFSKKTSNRLPEF
jgi:hypothetical protein